MFARPFLPIPRSGVNTLVKTLSPVSKDLKFTLLTYNILSPSYMWPQVYTYVPERHKNWSFRHELLEYELMNLYKADIMCFQEMTHRDYDEFWAPTALRKLGMGSNFIAKTAPKYWKSSEDELDGCSIFYNKNMFEFISSKGIYLNQLLSAFNEQEIKYLAQRELELTDGAGNSTGSTNLLQFLKDKNQVCLFVTLRHKPSGLIFVVINTHLYWKYDDVKLSQCSVIMRELRFVVNDLLKATREDIDITNDKVRILFTGDLNSSRDSMVINFLKGKTVNTMDLKLVNPMRTYLNHCVYDDIPSEWFDNTCYSGKLKGIFDYIWYHDTHFQLSKILTGIEVSQELRHNNQSGLPNIYHPSDHIPLLTEFDVLM